MLTLLHSVDFERPLTRAARLFYENADTAKGRQVAPVIWVARAVAVAVFAAAAVYLAVLFP